MTSLLLISLLSFQLDPDTMAALERAFARLERFETDFQQETYSDFFDETRAGGRLQLQKPGRMRMEYTEGEHRLIICNGERCLEYDRLADTRAYYNLDEVDDDPLTRLFFYQDGLQDNFLVDLRKDENGQTVYRFRPRHKGAFELLVWFDEDFLPRRVEVVSEDGEGTRFTFENFRVNPSFSEEAFRLPESAPDKPR